MTKVIPPRARSLIKSVLPPRMAGRLIRQVEGWVKTNGIEWTCNRLKAYHTGAIQLKAGHQDLATAVYSEAGVACSKHGTPHGVFGYVTKNYLASLDPQLLRKWHSLLRIYTLLVLDTVGSKHIEKIKSSICGEFTGNPAFLDQFSGLLEEFILSSVNGTAKLEIPNMSRLNPFSSSHKEGSIKREGGNSCLRAYERHTASMLTSVWIPDTLAGENPAERLRLALVASGADNEVAGHIATLREGGCKVRAIAVPNFWLQWLFQPLHQFLDRMISRDPCSTVHDQNGGAYFLTNALASNKEVFCFDLSSATDRFPLKLQQALLSGLGLKPWGDALESIAKGKWKLDDQIVSYQVGQPMGLYGSFPLFHLTHVFILYLLRRKLKLKEMPQELFRVLGDDVIITHPHLASVYKQCLTQLGVSISETKSVTSSSLGQFAGFTSSITKAGPVAYRPYKWTSLTQRSNLINSCYSLGKVVKKLGPDWAQAYDSLSRTWSYRNPDLSPLIPEQDQEAKIDSGLDSYLLGSYVTRLCDEMRLSLNGEFDRLWFTQVYLLLGQEEILNDDPGLDLTSDPRSGGWTIQDRNQNFRAISALEKPDNTHTNEFLQVDVDPVVRRLANVRSTIDTDPLA